MNSTYRPRIVILGMVLLSMLNRTVCTAADLRVSVKDQRGRAVADAVIVAAPTDPKNTRVKSLPLDAIDQVDKQFVPFVKVITVGSTVHFPNSDHVRHQVYSFSAAKKFELPLYAGAQAPPVVFERPGVVVLGCNIHDWMVGYIYVADSPYFAQTSAQGAATLTDLPPGEYQVRIWHPGLDVSQTASVRTLSVAASGDHAEWQINIKPSFRIPRASGASATPYP